MGYTIALSAGVFFGFLLAAIFIAGIEVHRKNKDEDK